MLDKLPLSAKPLFTEYIHLIKANLDYLIYGVYIQGSIALNDYDELKSDIDYITVLKREPSEEELSTIISIHNILKKNDRYVVSEGQYTTIDIISCNHNENKKIYPYYADGELKELNSGKIDATSLWILDKYGFSIYGHEVESLSIDLNFNDLISQMDYNLNKYWFNKINDKPELFLEDYWIEFGVLTICRIAYTLENREITSKLKAANYCLAKVDEKWKPIINEAIIVRKDIKHTFFSTKQQRAEVAVQFIEEMIQYYKKYFKIKNNDHRIATASKVKLKLADNNYLPEIIELHKDEEVREMLGVVELPDENYLKNNNKCYSILNENEEFIGIVELYNLSWENMRAELSIMIKSSVRGKGYGYDALNNILDIGFKELGLNRIWLRVLEYNSRAIELYKRVGFVQEGINRKESFRNGQYFSQIQMSILKSEWER